jgi:hypothetical protein
MMICWPILLIGSGVAFVLSYIYLFVMRCIGGGLIWLMIIISEVALILAGLYCWMIQKRFGPEDENTRLGIQIASYVLWAIAAILLIMTLCCCNAIRVGIAVMKTTAKFIAENMRIFFLPAISYVFIFVWCLLWFFGALYIYTIGYAVPRKNFEFMTEMMWDEYQKAIVTYYILGFFWINAFLIGCTQFIIAAAAAIWYFQSGSDKKSDTVATGIKWLFRYHLGSIALGSMIIAICQTIRVIFEYYRKKIQMMNQN